MCSHDYRDVRFINQLVYNWNVSPAIDPRPEMNDGRPRRRMQYGQAYECIRCGHGLRPSRPPQPDTRRGPVMYGE